MPKPQRSKFASGTKIMSVRGPQDPELRKIIYRLFYKILEKYKVK